jgi:hypothetical protein
MSKHPPEKLLQLWINEDLKVEQGIGQLLQHLVALSKQLEALEQRIRQVEQAQKKQP